MSTSEDPGQPPEDPRHPPGDLGAPVFIFGAPRSGTTYVVEMLNRHSKVFITNELRVMTFLNRVLNRLAGQQWILLNGRKDFLDSFRSEVPGMVRRHYQRIGAGPGDRWGDKNPHYADSTTDPECLDLIDDLFPDAQFVNVLRDGRDVVGSLVRKGWVDFETAIDVWRRHVEHAEEFCERIGPVRALDLRFEEVVADDVAAARRLCAFLGLEAEPAMLDFAAAQAAERTPFSIPMSDLTAVGSGSTRSRFDPEQEAMLTAEIGGLLQRLGYP